MGQTVLRAKSHSADALSYDGINCYQFPLATLGNSQTNATVAGAFPIGIAIKIVAVSLYFTVVNGAAAVTLNLCLGTAAENGLGPPDNTLSGIVPPTTAAAGNCLWASDQQVNGASAPVVNTCYTLYPISDAWDIIWPAAGLLTLRCGAGAAASGTALYVVAWGKEVDVHPQLPNPSNPFAPSLAML